MKVSFFIMPEGKKILLRDGKMKRPISIKQMPMDILKELGLVLFAS